MRAATSRGTTASNRQAMSKSKSKSRAHRRRAADLSLYRPNVGIALFNPQGAVWLGQRADVLDIDEPPGDCLWQMPQGGVDAGEDVISAAHRELEEETGARSVELITITPGWLVYDFPAGFSKKGKIGQRQKWAAMLFRGDDAEIDLLAHDADDPEFIDWRWGELEEAPDLIVPFKRDVYCEVVDAFKPLRDFIRSKTIK